MPQSPTADELLGFMRTTLTNLNAMAPGSKEYVPSDATPYAKEFHDFGAVVRRSSGVFFFGRNTWREEKGNYRQPSEI